MLYVIVRAVILVVCLSDSVLCNQVRWLMQGNILTDERLVPSNVDLETSKMYFPVSTRADFGYETKDNRTITCVIAAAVHMKGWVSIIEGGLKSQTVKARYITENSEPDVFFFLVQSAKRKPLVIESNIAWYSRYGIVYEPIRNWTQEGTEEISRHMDTITDVP